VQAAGWLRPPSAAAGIDLFADRWLLAPAHMRQEISAAVWQKTHWALRGTAAMKKIYVLALFALPLLLEGCYTPLVEGAQQGYDAVRRDPLQADAASGDRVAQYELGQTYCCQGGGPMDKVSVYNNYEATHWYCKAAQQGYGPAQLRLARIYSGHPIRGLHIALRASALVEPAATDLGTALMWASVAARNGVEDAIALRDELMQQATSQERAKAARLAKNWRAAPCRWAEVIPPAGSAKQ